MEMSTHRLEASSRIEERTFDSPPEQRRQRAPRRSKSGNQAADAGDLTADDEETHALDDLA